MSVMYRDLFYVKEKKNNPGYTRAVEAKLIIIRQNNFEILLLFRKYVMDYVTEYKEFIDIRDVDISSIIKVGRRIYYQTSQWRGKQREDKTGSSCVPRKKKQDQTKHEDLNINTVPTMAHMLSESKSAKTSLLVRSDM